MGQAALVRTESLDFPSPGAAGATSQTLPDHLSSVRPELGGLLVCEWKDLSVLSCILERPGVPGAL